MAKVKIKSKLENKVEETTSINEIMGIKIDNKIKYNDNGIKTIITLENDNLIIERESKEYTIHLHLSLDNITKGYYNIYSIGIINLEIKTDKLIIKSDKIYLEYTIIFGEKERTDFAFSLELEENL